jgi:hypothetical protein
MGKSKVEYYGTVLIDLTADTVTADKLASGITAHGKNGDAVTGTAAAYVEGNTLYVPEWMVSVSG